MNGDGQRASLDQGDTAPASHRFVRPCPGGARAPFRFSVDQGAKSDSANKGLRGLLRNSPQVPVERGDPERVAERRPSWAPFRRHDQIGEMRGHVLSAHKAVDNPAFVAPSPPARLANQQFRDRLGDEGGGGQGKTAIRTSRRRLADRRGPIVQPPNNSRDEKGRWQTPIDLQKCGLAQATVVMKEKEVFKTF